MAIADIAQPQALAASLAEANRELEREPTAPPAVLDLVASVCEQIAEAPRERWAAVAPDQWIELQQAALRTQRVVLGEADRRAQRAQLRLLVEELRFRLARLDEQDAYGADRPIGEVVRWLDRALPVGQSAKAELLGVHDRTYQRWVAENGASRPTGDDDRRVRLVARLVGELRHVLTGPGAVAWLERPLDALDGRTPVAVIESGDLDSERRLFALVASARAGSAA
jgi:uncharacterized protein (DUF2384 family)